MEAKRLVMLKEVPELENAEEENPILISAKESQDNDNDKKEGAKSIIAIIIFYFIGIVHIWHFKLLFYQKS